LSAEVKQRVATVAASMSANLSDPRAQADGCETLRTIVQGNAANKTIIVSAGGLEAIVAAMRAFTSSLPVQETGCDVIFHLALVEQLRAPIVSAEGIVVVVGAMRAFAANSSIQQSGCSVLDDLSKIEANRAPIVSAGGIEAVQAAMRAHPTVANINSWGKKAVDACAAQMRAFATHFWFTRFIDAVQQCTNSPKRHHLQISSHHSYFCIRFLQL
jgi:hypothetical protein